jgi:hypothetical protein
MRDCFGSAGVSTEYLAGYIQGVTDKAVGRAYCDGIGVPHPRGFIVCVPELGTSRRAGYRDGWLER